MKTYYGVDFNEQRRKLLKSKAAEKIIKNVIDNADKALDEEPRAFRMSEYMLFDQTGDRRTYESHYFKIRNDCSYLSIAYWLTDDDKYKTAITDRIMLICSEPTWCLPAHVGLEDNKTTEDIIGSVDLFQAETARLMTDIMAMVGDKLPNVVSQRIIYELRRRIIEPIKTRKFFWYDNTSNWAAVCGGGVAMAILHFATEAEKKELIPVLNGFMENFLAGYKDDGCCMEGQSYWHYGFGYFLIYAMAILDYSNGEINFFKREKVKKIALFQQRVRMGKTKCVCFSDSSNKYVLATGVICLLRRIYGREIIYPSLESLKYRGNIYSPKELLWFDTEYEEDETGFQTTFFEQSQWYIKQGEIYSFAAKAGNNKELHNHNDVGSFMIVTSDDDIPLADLEPAVYCKETFLASTRYSFLNYSSRGHSVPIINGQYQGAEDESYRAENVSAGESYFEAELQNAYECGLIKKIKRRFDLKKNSVALKDTFEFSDRTESVRERLVSLTEPEIKDGKVDLRTAEILFDTKLFNVEVTNERYLSHSQKIKTDVYLIDFIPINKDNVDFECEILIKKTEVDSN